MTDNNETVEELDAVKASLRTVRAQLGIAKGYIDELVAHDAAFPANPLEISQWTRKGIDLIERANKVFGS